MSRYVVTPSPDRLRWRVLDRRQDDYLSTDQGVREWLTEDAAHEYLGRRGQSNRERSPWATDSPSPEPPPTIA
ncbi:hypothetical protein GCM10027091_64290 [Streptomyces daliensis]